MVHRLTHGKIGLSLMGLLLPIVAFPVGWIGTDVAGVGTYFSGPPGVVAEMLTSSSFLSLTNANSAASAEDDPNVSLTAKEIEDFYSIQKRCPKRCEAREFDSERLGKIEHAMGFCKETGEAVFFYDDTFWGTGEKGLLVVDQGVYVSNGKISLFCRWGDLICVEIDNTHGLHIVGRCVCARSCRDSQQGERYRGGFATISDDRVRSELCNVFAKIKSRANPSFNDNNPQKVLPLRVDDLVDRVMEGFVLSKADAKKIAQSNIDGREQYFQIIHHFYPMAFSEYDDYLVFSGFKPNGVTPENEAVIRQIQEEGMVR